ncbi:MAG: pro-sigmaK processing inhibitor BofA family protein, partial [Oscillospiraceae bacterium]
MPEMPDIPEISNFATIAAIVICVILVVLLFKLLKTPLKWAMKLLLNALSGFVALFVLNLLGDLVGLTLAINWLNAIVVGV